MVAAEALDISQQVHILSMIIGGDKVLVDLRRE